MANKLTITDERLSPLGDFYGIFFEDINHAADGGLYAEMIRNRSFEFSPIDNPSYNGLTAWTEYEPQGTRVSLSIRNDAYADAANPHYLVMAVETDGAAAGVKNEGYNSGLPLYGGKEYNFSMRARAAEGTEITAAIVSADGKVYDSADFMLTDKWTDYSVVFKSTEDDFSARLLLSMKKSGKAYFDFVSLFPKDTYKERENGLRRDLAELLADLKPRFMRFPGGCLVHDGSLNKNERDSCYRWKSTLGDIKSRPARRSNWRYNQTLGLGYYEYFLFCEDIGAEPLPVLPAGYNPHSRQGVPFDELGEWIDDALDLIEFANGDSKTEWGAKRAELGHPEPFNLKYIAVGNEEVGQGFFDRYDYFHKAIKGKYPDIKIINSAGPFNHGSEYDKGWASARKNGSDIIDEHYYMSPEWFIANYHRYDNFSEEDTKVFLGEYASWDNNYYSALAEAAYMTGLENNAHAVALVCYAPLLCNAQYTNWAPDMIWFDNHRAYGSANYYVQKLFMNNLPTQLLRTQKEGFDKLNMLGTEKICGGIELAADGCSAEFYDIKITDSETGDIKTYDDLSFTNGGSAAVDEIISGHYTIELTAKRLSGDLGFKLTFAKTAERKKHVWSIGGWQNQDCIIDKFEGHASCLTQSRFSVETGIEYKLKLVVDGRMLKTYINGELWNDIEDKRLIQEELYYTAGIDDNTGDIIVKAVNVNDTPTKGIIEIPFIESITGSVSELYGYGKNDENSFEEPRKVYPIDSDIKADKSSFEFEFKPMSVSVFRIKR
ncbi:MAG: alpha-L-arabinofuranosidase C-terminal domain-containing protein [Candidatus Ornithomonoglobus sp.]